MVEVDRLITCSISGVKYKDRPGSHGSRKEMDGTKQYRLRLHRSYGALEREHVMKVASLSTRPLHCLHTSVYYFGTTRSHVGIAFLFSRGCDRGYSAREEGCRFLD